MSESSDLSSGLYFVEMRAAVAVGGVLFYLDDINLFEPWCCL